MLVPELKLCQKKSSPNVRDFGTREILIMESGILGCGIRNAAQRIRNPTKDRNPESKGPLVNVSFHCTVGNSQHTTTMVKY